MIEMVEDGNRPISYNYDTQAFKPLLSNASTLQTLKVGENPYWLGKETEGSSSSAVQPSNM
jgi:hypothetical protein